MTEQQLIERLIGLIHRLIHKGSFYDMNDLNDAIYLVAIAEGLGSAKEEAMECFQRIAENVIKAA